MNYFFQKSVRYLAMPICILSCNSYAQSSQPNIVLILADDLGYGDISCLNKEGKLQTPNIDGIGREGTIFTDAHSSSAVSTPSRYSLLTGRYNWRSSLKEGVLRGYSLPIIPITRTTIASLLKRAGYNTACIGKWHLGWVWNNIEAGVDKVDFSKPIQEGPTSVGFDYFYGISASLDMTPYVYVENNMATMIPTKIQPQGEGMKLMRKGPIADNFVPMEVLPHIIDKAVAYIQESSQKEEAFFLFLPLPAPHSPILPSPEFQGKSGLNPYGDFVLMVDAMVGRVLTALEESGISDNTLVLFASDNGCSPIASYPNLIAKGHNPSASFRGYKADLYEGGHRVPFLVRWRDKVRSHVVEQPVCYTDILATLSSVANVKMKDDEGEDSYNLTPLLFKKKSRANIREAIVHHSINGSFSIRKGDWKLLFSPGSAGWSFPNPKKDTTLLSTLPPIQLYNMKTDVSETKNLYKAYPQVVEELRELMIRYIEDGRSTPGIPQQNESTENWPQLKTIH